MSYKIRPKRRDYQADWTYTDDLEIYATFLEAQLGATCVVCGETVLFDHAEHLLLKHPTPKGGFKFWLDGKKFYSEKPSIQVLDIQKMTNYPATYQFFEQRDNGDVPFSHGNAVDLTREPHFYVVPPATY